MNNKYPRTITYKSLDPELLTAMALVEDSQYSVFFRYRTNGQTFDIKAQNLKSFFKEIKHMKKVFKKLKKKHDKT